MIADVDLYRPLQPLYLNPYQKLECIDLQHSLRDLQCDNQYRYNNYSSADLKRTLKVIDNDSNRKMKVEMGKVGESVANTYLNHISKRTADKIDSVAISSTYRHSSFFGFDNSSSTITIKFNRSDR